MDAHKHTNHAHRLAQNHTHKTQVHTKTMDTQNTQSHGHTPTQTIELRHTGTHAHKQTMDTQVHTHDGTRMSTKT